PIERSSRIRTRSPRSVSQRARLEPMNPAPPVMRTVRATAGPPRSGVDRLPRRHRDPADVLDERRGVDLVAMRPDLVQHRVDQFVTEQMRLQAELEQLRVLGVVVVLLELLARV